MSSDAQLRELHDMLDRLTGTEGPELRGSITAPAIRRFATASGETDPVYFDERVAAAAGHPALLAPPLMVSSVIEWESGPPLGALRTDGTGVARERWLPLDGHRLMGGGQDIVFHAPVYAGYEITGRPVLESAALREGASGLIVLIVLMTVFRTTGGADLLTCRETLIAR